NRLEEGRPWKSAKSCFVEAARSPSAGGAAALSPPARGGGGGGALPPPREQEREDVEPVPALNAERQGADELVASVGDVNGQLAIHVVMPPPREQPRVQEVRARAPHRPHEVVPGVAEIGKRGLVRDRLEGHAGSRR